MGMNLSHGGHLTHGSKVNASGILYNFVGYGINIRTIGETIQTNVKYQVEKALGMQVGSVKVVIEGIRE